MSAEMQKQKPTQNKRIENSGENQQTKLKSSDLSNKKKKKKIRFETSFSTSTNLFFSADQMSQVIDTPLIVYFIVSKHIFNSNVIYSFLFINESQSNEFLSNMPFKQHDHRKIKTELNNDDVRSSRFKKGLRSFPDIRKKKAGRNDDDRSFRVSSSFATSDFADNNKAFQQMPLSLLRLKMLKNVTDEKRILKEKNSGKADLRNQNWNEKMKYSNDNQTLLHSSKKKKPKQIHKQIWSEHNVFDNVKTLMYDDNEIVVKNINVVNKMIKIINKKNDWDSNLGEIFLKIYMAVLELLNDPMEKLKKKQDEASWCKWAIHKNTINIVNFNAELSDIFNLFRDFLERKTKISNKTRIKRDIDDETFSNPSSESDYSVENFYREKSHHASNFRSSRRSRKNSSQKKKKRSRHDINFDHDDGHHFQKSRFNDQMRRARSQTTRDDDDDHNRDDDSNEKKTKRKKSEAIKEKSNETDSDLNDIDSNFDDNLSDLRKAIKKKYDISMIKTVLGYRKCDPFYHQCFVQYGNNDALTYRMIFEKSAGLWNLEKTKNLVANQRGKLRTKTNWTYKKHDILRIAGVAWKSYDEHFLNFLIFLNPRNFQTTPSFTYVVIIWKKDNKKIFETKDSMRRILDNARNEVSNLTIFHRARVQEKKYLKTRIRAQNSKKTKTSQQKKKQINDTTRRFREKLKSRKIDKGDFRKNDFRKSDFRKNDFRKTNSRTQFKTIEGSSADSSMRLFHDDSPMSSSFKGQHSDIRNSLTKNEMMNMMFKFFEEKGPMYRIEQAVDSALSNMGDN